MFKNNTSLYCKPCIVKFIGEAIIVTKVSSDKKLPKPKYLELWDYEILIKLVLFS